MSKILEDHCIAPLKFLAYKFRLEKLNSSNLRVELLGLISRKHNILWLRPQLPSCFVHTSAVNSYWTSTWEGSCHHCRDVISPPFSLLNNSILSIAFPRMMEQWSPRFQIFLIGMAMLLMRRNWRPLHLVRNQLGPRWKVSQKKTWSTLNVPMFLCLP